METHNSVSLPSEGNMSSLSSRSRVSSPRGYAKKLARCYANLFTKVVSLASVYNITNINYIRRFILQLIAVCKHV